MTNSKNVFDDLLNKIRITESKEEIQSILYLLLNNLTGLTRTQIIGGKEIDPIDPIKLQDIINRINNHEPIQYILNEADFYGRKFFVNSSVLIPRPETEQIIEEVLVLTNNPLNEFKTLLDLGTGSGCLAVTLSKEMPKIQVTATDVSGSALIVAEINKNKHGTSVHLIEHNMLSDLPPLHTVDIIVSNPPYITTSEQNEMHKNVLQFEPHLALFAPTENPFIFYNAIAEQAKKILSPHGKIIVEINEQFGNEIKALFISYGFSNSKIRRDINNKDRVVMASWD